MKIIVPSLLLATFILLPTSVGATLKEEKKIEIQLTELNALVEYVIRNFNLEDESPLSTEKMREIVHDGSIWFANIQEDNGHFAYEYAPYDDVYLDDDNIVRQAGALYVLGEIARRDGGSVIQLDETIESAIEYFERISKEGRYEDYTFKCIAESASSRTCKLGSTSLALIGILSYVEAHPEKAETYAQSIDAYSTYVISAKKNNKGFRSGHRIGNDFQSEAESPFFNGEALLALVRYYQYSQDQSVKKIIDDTFLYLKNEPFDSALYLWIMAAIKDMQDMWPNEEYVTYTKEYTDWRIDSVARYRRTPRNYCAYIEGVVSAYSVLESSVTGDYLSKLRSEIDYWNTRSSYLQLSKDDTYRIFDENGSLELKQVINPAFAWGGFLTGKEDLTQRIDFTQHCLNSYLQTLVDIDRETL